MGMYRKTFDCCGSVTETDAWEPEHCPFCHPAQAPQQEGQARELPPLTRYNPTVAPFGYDHVAEMTVHAEGEWVRFADVEAAQSAPAVPDENAIRAAVEYVVEVQGIDVQDERESELVETVAIAVVQHLGLASAPAQPTVPELVAFFRNDGHQIGKQGDACGWTPEETAVRAMRLLLKNDPTPVIPQGEAK